MSEYDSDIEFDFFDEPETEEAPDRPRLPRRTPPGGPRRPRRPMRAPQGFIPMLRLAGLVAFLILAVIVLVFLVRGCASSSKHSSFADYMDRVRTIAASSTQLGRQLNTTLTATGIKESKLESSIRGYAAQEQQLADQAAAITPPGPLHTEHDHLIEALQLRASALSRLADAFAQTATSNNATQAGTLLSEQTRLLVASDVNWDFYFKDASKRVLQNENVTGVSVPDSTVVPNPDLASTQAMSDIWRRLHGRVATSTPGGKHGNALTSVTALPDGKKLDPHASAATNTITTSTDLAFSVAVTDSGDFQEFNVKVTLTIAATPNPIVKTKIIPVINAGETKTITFTDFRSPPIAQPTTLKVDVQPVPGETNRTNNTAQYNVFFSLGG